jgi:hypothetical protein
MARRPVQVVEQFWSSYPLMGPRDVLSFLGRPREFAKPRITITLKAGYQYIYSVMKPTRCTNFSDLFWNETLHISDSSSLHHQELFTARSAMVYVIQVCRQLSSSRIRMEQSSSWFCCLKAVYKPISLLSVQWITPDDGQRNCPKYVDFHSKINLRN